MSITATILAGAALVGIAFATPFFCDPKPQKNRKDAPLFLHPYPAQDHWNALDYQPLFLGVNSGVATTAMLAAWR
ncbi:hypothetical protein EIP91_009521 [Steccherinum ochraceum]|uniref:Uncharacterized protein n=1 Tax=Steccherinum ochraceum TaxID=92696 RepID=A0A4R0R1K1_9APHY|nr:hypothetical protein EIP91_009521 [Steccherinum ochraceum]